MFRQAGELPPQTLGLQVGLPGPVTYEQVPTRFGATHESHCPSHTVSQHTPFTQLPLWHWVVAPQLWPLVSLDTHWDPLQKYPAMQPESFEHVPGQLAVAPVHTYGEQEGLPGPVTFVHVPVVHTSQPPAQAVLQQTPSTQLPLTHSAPAAQPDPLTLSCVHAPATH